MHILLLLEILFTIALHPYKASPVICSICGNEITTTEHSIIIESNSSISSTYTEENNTPLYRQTFQNPHGIIFELSTYTDATLQCESTLHHEDSFYSNYTWSICACPRCGTHQGWHFKSTVPSLHPSSFYGVPTRNTHTLNTHSHTYTYEL